MEFEKQVRAIYRTLWLAWRRWLCNFVTPVGADGFETVHDNFQRKVPIDNVDAPEMTRLEKVRWHLSTDMLGLEIGPSHNPIVPKAEGWNVRTIDHATREDLIAKYRDHGVDLNKIEDVDYVWHGEPIDELIGPTGLESFDYCIASHVIEHFPDLIGFLQNIERLLVPGGLLSLVVPDKRHCFDFFKPLTNTADLLEAHEFKRRTHSRRTVFEFVAYSAKRGDAITWDSRQQGELGFAHSLTQAKQMFDSYSESEPYADFHRSYFVPSSFELVVLELRALGLTTFSVAHTFDPAGCEFYVTLEKTGTHTLPDETCERQRLELLRATTIEVCAAFA